MSMPLTRNSSNAKSLCLVLVCYVSVIALSAALGFSFVLHALNVMLAIGAFIASGALALLAFRLRPKVLGMLAGCVVILCWSLLMLGFGAIALFDGNSAVTVRLDDQWLCRETVYGFAAGDSGEEWEIYKRYLFIDHRVYRRMHSEVYAENTPQIPANVAAVAARCQVKVNVARTTAQALPK